MQLMPSYHRSITLHPSVTGRGIAHSTQRRFTFPSQLLQGPVHDRRARLLAQRISADREIDLQQIMDDMRDLESLDMLNKVSPKCAANSLRHRLSPCYLLRSWCDIAGSGYKDAASSSRFSQASESNRETDRSRRQEHCTHCSTARRSVELSAPLASCRRLCLRCMAPLGWRSQIASCPVRFQSCRT